MPDKNIAGALNDFSNGFFLLKFSLQLFSTVAFGLGLYILRSFSNKLGQIEETIAECRKACEVRRRLCFGGLSETTATHGERIAALEAVIRERGKK